MSLFITGTDTNVGKTIVTSGLAALLMKQGRRVCIYKPIQTGCSNPQMPEDPMRVQWLLGEEIPVFCTYCFALPAAPYAADPENTIQPCKILEEFKRLQSMFDVVLVEGAGGSRVPVAPNVDMRDLIRMLQLPVLVVARMTLGTMNHMLLTVDSLLSQRIEVTGVVLSQAHASDIADPSVQTLIPTLEAFLPVPILGTLPPLPQDAAGCFRQASVLSHFEALNFKEMGLAPELMLV